MTRDLGPDTPRAARGRCLTVWLAVTLGLALGASRVLPGLVTALTQTSVRFDLLLVTVCQVALLLAGAWLWLAASVVALDAATDATRRRRGVPTALRRLVLLACGVALVGGLASPGWAEPGEASRDRGHVPALVEGLALPDRQTAAASVAALVRAAETAQPRASRSPALPRRVVVSPGDTLWALAAATLPPEASAADVAAAVHRLHATNRATVGPDPDLILPGQVLDLPHPREESR